MVAGLKLGCWSAWEMMGGEVGSDFLGMSWVDFELDFWWRGHFF